MAEQEKGQINHAYLILASKIKQAKKDFDGVVNRLSAVIDPSIKPQPDAAVTGTIFTVPMAKSLFDLSTTLDSLMNKIKSLSVSLDLSK